eukprot:CAMPEP_0176491812 /NCGR_PEP_ID=MMETSP0200_2-20121128/8635_1 /TAXON_ID=947934 /ORGANISM="Chaetoceros sp., Strain GSL56" /LENGTH=299 /DNA_ID=CAMNT_0017889273 /DNA_START=119 /DNA_END=1015 /DNA_ORIENTATION=+
MKTFFSPILVIVLVVASNVLMFYLGKATTTLETTTTTNISSKASTTNSIRATDQDHKAHQTNNSSGGVLSPIETSKFDIIKQTLYKEASNIAKTTRKKITLEEGWKRGTGGLDDTDRMVLGELYYNATSVFEYGLGESTLIAAFTGVPRYSGIDSDPVWVTKARKEAGQDHFRFYYGDIGDTASFGNPVDNTLQKIHYNYQMSGLALEDSAFDVYLVDGRYRVACASLSFLHAIKTGGDMEKVRVGIHDNDQSARGYAEFKTVADVVIENKKLWVYKLKQGITEDDLYNLWLKFRNNQI